MFCEQPLYPSDYIIDFVCGSRGFFEHLLKDYQRVSGIAVVFGIDVPYGVLYTVDKDVMPLFVTSQNVSSVELFR